MKLSGITSLIFLIVFSLTNKLESQDCYLLKAERLFDGEKLEQNKVILIKGNEILEVGEEKEISGQGCMVMDFGNATIMPGMIEGHSHLLLHPYNEVSWNDQVLKESIAERAIRGAVHAENTLMAGFTTVRDLGSEGAGYADVGIKESINKGVIPGPRLIVAGKAIVANGSYGPKGFNEQVEVPLGAEIADGHDNLIKVVRDQIGKGSDVIKVYADYRWGPNGEAMPTFTLDELKLIVEVANSSGRDVVAHASTKEGMKRATLAGVSTIEHGDEGDSEIFMLMKEKGVAFCPTIAAGDAISQYRGWNKGVDPDPDRIVLKKASMKKAISSGVTIVAGGDVGVFTHGDNVRELEMMEAYGMSTLSVIQAVTSVNADVFKLDRLGRIQRGKLADIIVVDGNPLSNISSLRSVKMVMKDGRIYKNQNN